MSTRLEPDPLMPDAELFDSGYTPNELGRISESLTKGFVSDWPDEAFAIELVIGLSDGDVGELSDKGTVMLSTPRAVIDARVAALRAALKDGTPLREAVEAI